MKRIIIVCEGETEQAFCKTVLSPHFAPKGIFIETPLIKHSNGGIVRWSILKRQIEHHLSENAYVTTLIDYYGLYSKQEFPQWGEAERIADKAQRMTFLEQAMLTAITDDIRFHFIPYIQLHEFEGLLFHSFDIFKKTIPSNDLVGIEELKTTLSEFTNPEMINTCKETSPSHRLKRIIRGYNKVVYGDILAESIGLNQIRAKCPRFNDWITTLEKLS